MSTSLFGEGSMLFGAGFMLFGAGSMGPDHPWIFQIRPEAATFPGGVRPAEAGTPRSAGRGRDPSFGRQRPGHLVRPAEAGTPQATAGQRRAAASTVETEDTLVGGLGLFEVLLLLFTAGAFAAVTVGSRRVRNYGRNLGRGRGWEFPSEVLDELENLRIRVDAMVDRLTEVTERLDAADIPKLPPHPDPEE